MLAITRRRLVAAPALLAATPSAFATTPTLVIWKTRGCPCCTGWAERFEAAGFATRIEEVGDVGVVRAAAGVPADLGGCHTSRIAGYVVEGHVPVAAVTRLLAERPAILGIAVPGMPVGSPGMEIEGQPAQPYDVIAFAADGGRSVFMAVR